MQVKFRHWTCDVALARYANNGRAAIKLNDAKTGDLVAVATVNLDQFPLAPDEVFIKDWSENEGIKDALVKAGIVASTGERVPTGFVEADVCKLLVAP
jgi:hypothetical protein